MAGSVDVGLVRAAARRHRLYCHYPCFDERDAYEFLVRLLGGGRPAWEDGGFVATAWGARMSRFAYGHLEG